MGDTEKLVKEQSNLVTDYIKTKTQHESEPKIPADMTIPGDIDDMLNKITNSAPDHIDSKMLSNMLKMAFFLSLNKSEVLNLKIGDVIDQNGQIKDKILTTKDPIPLSGDVKQLIIDHQKYLISDENYKDQSDAFLFQNKKGKKYGESARQLRDTFKFFKPFQTLREAFIISYYNALNDDISVKQKYETVAKCARIKTKQVKAIITSNKILAGKKTSISEKLNETWKHMTDINKINETFKVQLKNFEERSKELINSIIKSNKSPRDLRGILLKEISEVFKKNKIVINDIDGSINLYPHKNLSYSNTIEKLPQKDNKYETFEKLLWLIDNAVIFPTSDIDEVDRYKDLFLKILSTLSFDEDPQENQILKKSLMNSFADNFFERNVVFNNEIGSPYIWDKKKEDKDRKIILTGLIKQGFKEDVSGKLDAGLLSILEDSENEDLKPLVTYILNNKEHDSPSLEISSYHFDCYLNDLENIAERIQRSQWDEKVLGIERLAPYKEVVCFVADNLKVNYDRNEGVNVIEHKILGKILEYSWEDMDDSLKTEFLKGIFRKKIVKTDRSLFPKEEMMSIIGQEGEEFYKISFIILNAHTMLALKEKLTINRESNFVKWVQLFEDVIGKSFKKISIDSFNKETNFYRALTYIVHIPMLRQLQKRREILFRKF